MISYTNEQCLILMKHILIPKQIIMDFDRGLHFPLFWLGPMEYARFSLSQGFLWFLRNLSPQPSRKKILCRSRHCHILFLINSFSESLIINPSHLEKKNVPAPALSKIFLIKTFLINQWSTPAIVKKRMCRLGHCQKLFLFKTPLII